jgi:hypothetical protein
MDVREIGVGGVDWIRLAQDRDRWRAVVSAVINPWGSCATELVSGFHNATVSSSDYIALTAFFHTLFYSLIILTFDAA